MDKTATRAWVRASRRERPIAERERAGVALADAVMALPEVTHAVASGGSVAAYLSMPTEPSTAPLLSAVRRAGGFVVVPRVKDASLEWVRLDDGTALVRAPLGMDEPSGPALGVGAPAVAGCAVIVLPALAVDLDGRRIGQGGGFYDRLVADLPAESRPTLIALLFDDEVVGHLPAEPHDLTVDIAVTPTRTLRFHTGAS